MIYNAAYENNVESWFGMLKCGIMGAYHHADEFKSTTVAIRQVFSGPMIYKELVGNSY